MRKTHLWYAVATLLLTLNIASAELAVPRLTGRVVDQAKMLSAHDEQRITSALEQLARVPQGAQMAVLTVPSMKGDALELFSIRVVEAWKLGKQDVDNGLLLLISRDDRQMRLETGYGLEGRLTDARCGDIIRDMKSYFREQRFGDGILFAIGTVQHQLTGAPPAGMPAAPRAATTRKSPNIGFLVILILFFILPAIRRSPYGWAHTILLGSSMRGGGGFGGGGFGGGGFSGGGGGFGGGGASGSW